MDAGDLVVLFADLQTALVQNSITNSPKMVETAAGGLARAAALLGIPVLFSVVPEKGGPAVHLASLAEHTTDTNTFTRECASPFMDVRLVTALKETGRRTLLIAGFATEAVTLKAALDGLQAGYAVFVALDAGGGRSTRTEEAALRRIERAGAVTTSVVDIIISCAPDFAASPGREAFAIVHELMAAHG